MECREVIARLKEISPEAMALDWDNVGLLAGRADKEVKRIYLALDATDEVIREAKEQKADLLVTHHPLIFKPLKQINDQSSVSRKILNLIQADISYYAMHTNFDCAPGGMADLAAQYMELSDTRILSPEGENEAGVYGVGRIGRLQVPMTLREAAQAVKEKFCLPFVLVYGDLDSNEKLSTAAIAPGSGKSFLSDGIAKGAQVMITGDIGHHDGIDAVAEKMAVIDAGHYGLEHIFVDFAEQYLNAEFGEQIELIKAPLIFPAAVII